MKQFIVDRHTTPNTPTLEQVPTEKIPIYENRAAVTADLANLSVGQIVATKDTGDELAQPVDVVEEGNLHAVTSNAVAETFLELEDITSLCSFSVSTTAIKIYRRLGFVLVIADGNISQNITITLPTGMKIQRGQIATDIQGNYFFATEDDRIVFAKNGNNYVNLSCLFLCIK